MKVNPNSSPNTTPGTFSSGLPSAEPPAAAVEILPEKPEATSYTRFDLWLHRITVLMFVFVCAAVGVLLVILPWRPEWTDNHLLLAYPGLRTFISNGFVRGFCSGLGVLDIWIGFWEAIHYSEAKRA